MLSLKTIGMPCIGPRVRPAARSSVERARVGDRRRVQRQHRSQRRPVAIEAATAGPDIRGRRLRTSSRRGVSASWICGAVFSTTVNGAAGAPVARRRQFDDLRSLQRRQAAQIRRRNQLTRDGGHARDFGSGLGNLRRGARVRRRILRRDERIPKRDRKAAARIVDLAQSLHDEGHQRDGLSGLHRQREYVADVRGIVARPAAGEGIAVHVADAGEQTGRVRAEHVGGWPVARRARARARRRCIAFCITVTNVSPRSIARSPLDDVATVTGPPSSKAPAAPPQATSTIAILARAVREAVDVAQVVGVRRREDAARDQDVAPQHRRDRVEALARRRGRGRSRSGTAARTSVAPPDARTRILR